MKGFQSMSASSAGLHLAGGPVDREPVLGVSPIVDVNLPVARVAGRTFGPYS